ncbi:putative phosphatase regulatory subunit-domain-containing protein [Apiosordaria backusii]|uniref:Phosphatase regulatory subunit-domain-containing protein n=1 Tax=Apiosordaria backusii TaxID=314023 RepID=A0AA40EXP7_9PEZI|nr:putative phosphatase regulatory subunit-domain-containing protein [Apiosordaria backusii]
MPYTPPTHRSPASSVPTSPDGSRRPSFHQPQSPSSRPVLPRSASYLMKHRRTPSASSQRSATEPTPESTAEDLQKLVISTSVRQSPPPVTGDRRMPNAAIISPPDSSDDDMPQARGDAHARKIENLKELQDVVSQIPQQRSSSPPKGTVADKQALDAGDLLVLPAQVNAITQGMHHSFSTSSLDGLLGGNRRFSHARSQTEPHITISKSGSSSATGSEEDSDSERQRKPQMVRKKSGELVRPALRPPSRRRPSSMPGTPTFSKAVHFDSHLEHVRHFLQVDRPLAVSAGSSPIDHYDSDTEYPFAGDDRATARSPPFEWEITMPTFPVETPARKAQTVRLERVWLSKDQKCLIGSVAVANLAFQKNVVCRFTLDYWKTTSEVAAEYISDIRPVDTPYPQDRFNFTIKLSDLANLESKTLYFCIRFSFNGQEHWDNNGGTNFQVDFHKKMLPQNGKQGVIGAASRPANGLPKSNRRPSSALAQKPKAKFAGADEFGNGAKINFDQSIHDYLGESRAGGIRLKGVKSAANLPSDNLSSRLAPPSGQAFANRYDFGASLTLAIQTAKDSMSSKSDGLYMKPHWRAAPQTTTTAPSQTTTTAATKPSDVKPTDKAEPSTRADKPAKPAAVITAPPVVKPSIVPGTDSPGASIATASYEELVNKYCFFGTKQSSPLLSHDPSRPGRFDGVDDGLRSNNSSATSSYEGSPVQMGNYHHSHSGTQHHSLHPKDPNPYFQQHSAFVAMGASPAESPIMGFPTQRTDGTMTAPGQKNDRPSGAFASFAGTSPNEYPYQHMPDRFPFFGAEAHSATAIRG